MAPRPRWWHTLQEARRQACLGIDFYNRAGDRRSFADFVVHMHLAWQYMLHADLEKRMVDVFYREKGRFVRGKDGEPRTWELQRCLKEEFAENDPTRVNVEFFIGLRNKVEHRFQDAFIVATSAHAHAYVINFEVEVVRRFGATASLADILRFPVFVQSLTPEGLDEQRSLRKKLPASAKAYITAFESGLPAEVRDDQRFSYRVRLTPMKGPKSEADLAVNFVRQDELSADDRAEMERLAKSGMVLVTEKTRDVPLKDELLPKPTAAAIEAQLPFRFNTNHFAKMWKRHGVRPDWKASDPAKTDTKYCIYVPAYKNYVYTPAYVQRCVDEVKTPKKFERALGMKPVLKAPVTKIRRRPVPRVAAALEQEQGTAS